MFQHFQCRHEVEGPVGEGQPSIAADADEILGRGAGEFNIAACHLHLERRQHFRQQVEFVTTDLQNPGLPPQPAHKRPQQQGGQTIPLVLIKGKRQHRGRIQALHFHVPCATVTRGSSACSCPLRGATELCHALSIAASCTAHSGWTNP